MFDDGRSRRGASLRRLLCAALSVASIQVSLAQTPPPAAVTLRDGQTLTASQRADEAAEYVIDARAGSVYLLRVEQRGLDLIVSVESPDGVATSYNSPLLRDGPEVVLLEAASTGAWRVTVHSEEHTGAVGGHAVGYRELSAATPSEELAAWRLMSTGGAANHESGDEAWARAVAAYAGAAALWRELGRREEQAHAVFSAATLQYWQLYDWDAAAELASDAAALYAELGDAALAANAVHLQAAALVEKALEASAVDDSVPPDDSPQDDGDALFAEALRLFGEVRAVHRQLGNVYELGLVVNNLGYAYHSRGDFEQARVHLEEAAALMQSVDEWGGELNPRANLAALDAEAGYLASAIDASTRVIELLPDGKLLRERANTLDNLGVFHQMFGNAEQALQSFAAALEIQRNIEDAQGEGRTLRGIGQTYFGLGELDLAKQYLQQALPIARATNDGRTQEAVLRTLGNIAFLEADYAAALQHHEQALDVVASASDRAYLQVLAAKDLRALGRIDAATALAGEALAAAETMDSAPLLADALHESGRVLLAQGDARSAVDALERAAALYERIDSTERHGEALHSLSLAARAQGRLDAALEYGDAALAQVERLRARVADPELRALYSASRSDYYATQIDLLMSRHDARVGDGDEFLRAALATSERARARMTADLLREASVQLRGGFDDVLQQRQTALVARLADLSHQRTVTLQQPSGNARETRLAAVLADMAAVENQLNLLEIELRRNNPKLADLTAPQSLTVDEMQALLDPDSVLLQYALGEERSFVWAVTRERVVGVQLAGRAAMEAAARRAIESLKSYRPGSPTPLAADLARVAELALAPVVAHVDKPRIVLAVDGALQYIPFGILPVTLADGAGGRLLDRHEIVGIPSLSAMAVQTPADSRSRADKTMAVFADPVVEPTDPRLRGVGQLTAAASSASSGLIARSSIGTDLVRLPATAREADVIAALVPDERLFVARGFDASRESVLAAELGQYRYIHFATHGLVDSRYPGLSALALSQFDSRGAPQEGFLRLHDIYNLRLNADLVVLSACETALGRDIRGEGLIGMTQGFMYAGARSVVASLWQVPDRATAELMTRFYGFMLEDRLPPAAALRAAQRDLAAERRWSSPYFWGGFVLVGDWR